MIIDSGTLVIGTFTAFLCGYSVSLTRSLGKVSLAAVLSGLIAMAIFFAFAQAVF